MWRGRGVALSPQFFLPPPSGISGSLQTEINKLTQIKSNQMFVFEETEGKAGVRGENLSEQSREPTKSTDI